MKHILFLALLICLPVICFGQAGSDTLETYFGQTFIPDQTFKGSDLMGWHTFGNAEWHAHNGKVTGTVKSGGNGGWLVLNKSFQDVGFHALFKATGDDNEATGVLVRIQKIRDGMTGIFLSLKPGDIGPYSITLNKDGNITSRKRLAYAGGIWYRIAPPLDKKIPNDNFSEVTPHVDVARYSNFAPPKGQNRFPSRPKPKVDLPVKTPDTGLHEGKWNQIEIFMDVNVIRSFLNDGSEIGGRVDKDEDSGMDGYGPIALYVSGHGKVQFKDVMYKDLAMKMTPKIKISPRFKVERINDMYYSWACTTGDFNRDGHLDIIAGPNIYYGPDFTIRREIEPATAVSPSRQFSWNHIENVYDFNHDGWPDVLSSAFSTTIYINPKGESRRWKSYDILPGVHQGEITEFVDINKDGTPDLVYDGDGSLQYAEPDPSDPTKPWIQHRISEKGYGVPHGLGVGDINGDGRLDVVNPYGWWEQPAKLADGKPWIYHPVAFGRHAHRSNHIGGMVMGIYDVNGNGLMDVVTSLNAHGFGMAWFEQRRDKKGHIYFVRHMISDDYAYKHNAGGVSFSEPHGNTFADIDGDGIPDFIVGKRYWTHLDDYYDPNPYGPPVFYWYKTVRDPKAPGGARFVPHLIDNRSGVGSQVTAVDLNHDGAVDLITSTDSGTFIFWNKSNYKKK